LPGFDILYIATLDERGQPMKKVALLAVLLMSFSAAAIAQDAPAAEIFGGYSFVHVGTSSSPGMPNDFNMHGFDASLAVNANKWMGFVADFGSVHKKGGYDIISRSCYSLMFGPKFALRKARTTTFAQALFGVRRQNTDDRFANFANMSDFSMALGGGLDVNVNDRIAIRPMQLEYVGVRAGGEEFLSNLRFSAGVVFKLGKRGS
jgi:opacity protein-like surface antigen